MMHNDGDYNYWGMHMGWWFFIVLFVVVLMVLFFNSRKEDNDDKPHLTQLAHFMKTIVLQNQRHS